jgi:hypothetical protein
MRLRRQLPGQDLGVVLVAIRAAAERLPRPRVHLLVRRQVRIPLDLLPVGETQCLSALAEPAARRLALLGGVQVVPARGLLPGGPVEVILKIEPRSWCHHRHLRSPPAGRTMIVSAAELTMIV